MGIWLGPMGKAMLEAKDIVYGGNYSFTVSPDGEHWELALLSGNAESLVFKKSPGNCDIFLVAGGQPGQPYSGTQGSDYYGPVHGSNGGKGGGCVTAASVKLSSNTNYNVDIGTSGENSSFSGGGISYTAVSGSGSNGGTGGVAVNGQYNIQNATAGSDGVFAYGKNSDTLITPAFIGHKFGSGGGAGGAHLGVSSTFNASGSLGGESNGPSHEYGKGGTGNSGNGTTGYANHGQGGGGAQYNYGNATQGLGGSGIIFIRDAQ